MRFVIVNENIYLEEIPFLRERYKIVSSAAEEEYVYETDNELEEKLKVLEEAGFIKRVKEKVNEIEKASDIIPATERVEILQGGKMNLRVYLAGHQFEFTEDELESSRALWKRLLRLKKAIRITQKEWSEILQNWLERSENIKEINEEEELRESILAKLQRSIIFNEIEKALSKNVLYYDKEQPNVVWCLSTNLKEIGGDKHSMRKIRWVMSDYTIGASQQKRIKGDRVRFWGLIIDKCGIDLKNQMWNAEKDSGILESSERENEEGSSDEYNNEG
jgi:cell fate (sporulation/competence/biofilm development) regulator YlbF (YheA/YmcA/DUF963 family)